MLPFLKNQKEASASGDDDEVKRLKTTEDDFSMLDAVAEDILAAVKKGDKAMLKGALEALCMHIMTIDEEQDQLEMT